ncbi:hypothetical protein [Vibrio phage vB_VmeM-Yong XC32]|nr:hypothetical protein [Vibrio phage vB_VmeM-Yong XC31]QAX96406.1 hypothetical protein [Vibrio phage vB_VmeM-Yong XC32]QAX96723.1 hypothetical protein [Vibrio phage vB_VmeM-Yong MS31]QAX97042.1 hypothetical protein [Vibrio phage vB_VmeM-Yong MS32]
MIKKNVTVWTWMAFIILSLLSLGVTLFGSFLFSIGVVVPELMIISVVGMALCVLGWSLSKVASLYTPF